MSAPSAAASRVPVVLLAAGESARFGGIKQLALIGGEPMLRRVARALLELDAPVIVVTGAHAEQVEAALAGLPVAIERHAGWAAGMGSSLAAGFRRLMAEHPDATGALLCLADQPFPDVAMLQAMLTQHAAASDAVLASAEDGVVGPPVLFPRDCFATLAGWSGPRGARALLEREARRVERFTVTDPIDVDTPEDLQRVRDHLATRPTISP